MNAHGVERRLRLRRSSAGSACLLCAYGLLLGVAVARAQPTAADGGVAEQLLDVESSRAKLSNLSPDTIAKLLERYAAEPSAMAVVREALRAAERDPDRFESMLRRARWRGLVPSLLVGARRGQGVDLRTTVTDDDGTRFTSGDDLLLSATLRFELGRLLFADEEVAIAREARAARVARLELVRDVIHWYFLRRRLQLERDALEHTSVARELKIAELEALLDAFTNGMFGRMIGRQRKAWTIDESTPDSEPRSPPR